MHSVDINCDMGEGFENDEALMPYITSANIACGFHAGDTDTMKSTIALALKHEVAIGAHPGFPDRENFGRKNMDMTPDEVYDMVLYQVRLLSKIALEEGAKVTHVKPHGALYNMAAEDALLAKAIARAVRAVDNKLALFGLSGSYLIQEGINVSLQTVNEAFADRTYLADGTLTPRREKNALIEDKDASLQQALQLVMKQTVRSISGETISLIADTICIHGDGENALVFAKNIYKGLKVHKIVLKNTIR
ncbi:5-oxoprolinase subunit PxpA [Pinibacter aurantiacus]|uniref:5-oxoprolinase subunit A n=1 Tax=Pinibacter aurantiacus TaxID=2851599 RepID=A0A9E2SEB4_9BACT|nr:5-oxoprolinase subunit PxpA [Pinibacter aurantiacus]MBV4358465.1 LamB/YcsF family protein [Pinibacter aurantiacus]